MSKTKLDRTTFTTSRLLDFCSRKELIAQTGHQPADWPLVLVKELVDNALDACEDVGAPPEIAVKVDENGITVMDNGPGIPADTVAGVLDFGVRVSNREAYVAPDRGAQGNALKTVVAMPFVLDGEQGQVEIVACGKRHRIILKVDHIRQCPDVNHQVEAVPECEGGTAVTVRWPDSASRIPETGGDQFLQIDDEDDNEGDDEPGDSASIISAARSRFLQIADDYTWLNPHLCLTVDWFGEPRRVGATAPDWRKWLPSNPTCPHWYGEEHLNRLVSAYVAHDADNGRDRTVRELVAEFRGLTGTAKQKKVLEAAGMSRTSLSSLVNGNGLDRSATTRLLAAMKEHAKPVKPSALGVIGKDHFRQRFEDLGCEMESYDYRKVADATDSVPWVVETAFAWRGEVEKPRRLVTGVNWSPGIINPFRQLGKYGKSLDTVLAKQMADGDEPVILVLHMACPRVEYTDRGKSAVVIGD